MEEGLELRIENDSPDLDMPRICSLFDGKDMSRYCLEVDGQFAVISFGVEIYIVAVFVEGVGGEGHRFAGPVHDRNHEVD